MSDPRDFIIENGVLTKYVGPGGDVVIPEGVTEIGNWAFENSMNLTGVTISDSVTSIGTEAFRGCSSLTSMTIPESVTSIGDKAFWGCSGLTFLTIPKSVTNISRWAFQGCVGLRSVKIPDGVTSIGYGSFSGCISLTDVTIPESVKSIGESAFYGCSKMRGITIPESVATIKPEMFDKRITFVVEDVSRLPAPLRPNAAIGFAESGGNKEKPWFASNTKYMRANAAKLVNTAMEHPALLSLMCREKLIAPKHVELYVDAAQKSGNAEAIAMMLDYQANKVSEKQKATVEKRKEKEQDTLVDRMIARQGKEGIEGLSIAVTGKLHTFEKRDELKAFLAEKGAKLASSLTAKVDYLIMNDPKSDSEKAQKARKLGVEVITEGRFNDLAGRAFVMDGTVLKGYRGSGGDVVIPEGVTEIGSYVFSGYWNLTSVSIPDSVARINLWEWSGSCSNVTIHAPAGSYAEQYAKENKIPFVAEEVQLHGRINNPHPAGAGDRGT